MAITQDQVGQKNEQRDKLQIKMQELSDQRQFFNGSISNLEDRIDTFKQHLQHEREKARIASYQNNLSIPEAEQKSPNTKKRRATNNKDTQS